MYIVRFRASNDIIAQQNSPLALGLNGADIYAGFDPETMEFLKFDGDQLPEFYRVEEDGNVIEKSFHEKASEGLIRFSRDIFRHARYDAESSMRPNMQAVKIGLEANLIRTIDECNLAFSMLDEEFEARVGEMRYTPGFEAKLMKAYIEWLEEGKPADDEREKKYRKMQKDLDSVKEEYKSLREQLKSIIIPLKRTS